MKPIIEVSGLSKEYVRGAKKEPYLSIRDQFSQAVKFNKRKDTFWALDDINFKVEQGDSLAIIGKNGAGKSTLLKILSKITPPTKGEITLRGRLASLLEVGTGFHPELTGRENIYLNGSILGLGRKEINQQFDAIVDFSGVEAFLDTPLKHYSSGMQLRLAFAVAAHLEPEILVIDEVLAVGDSAFQKKCIDKMTEVSRGGRTLLFVSHNMQAIKNLCSRGIMLEDGRLKGNDNIENIIDSYVHNHQQSLTSLTISLKNNDRKQALGELQLSSITANKWELYPGEMLSFSLSVIAKAEKKYSDLLFGIAIRDSIGQNITHLSNLFLDKSVSNYQSGSEFIFRIPEIDLSPGKYTITLFLKANEEIQDWIENAAQITIISGNRYGFSNSDMIKGLYQPKFNFEIKS